jgi:hypothetical protein
MKVVSDVQREITARLINCMYDLKSRGKIKSKKEFANSVRFPYTHLVRLEKSDCCSISLDAIYFAILVFKINPDYLLFGKGLMYRDN